MLEERTAQLTKADPPRIKIVFPYSKSDLFNIKSLFGNKLSSNKKYWTCNLTKDNVLQLKKWGFYLFRSLRKASKNLHINKNKILPISVHNFGKLPYRYQKIGLGFIESRNGRALIGDQMGLGKTIQALMYLQLHKEYRPAVIVAPGNLKPNWQKEIQECLTNPKEQVIYGTNTKQKLHGEIIVINYEILANDYRTNPYNKRRPIEIPYTGWVDYLINIKPQVLIVDECHFIINANAQRTKAIKKLAKGIPHIIGLSGTPSKNRARELDTMIRIIDPSVLPPFWQTAHRYYGAKRNRFGWNFDGATNTEEFHKLLTSTVMIRRKKSEVLKELPKKIRSIVPLQINNRTEYTEAEEQFIRWITKRKGAKAAERAKNAQQLVKVEALKQLAVEGKLHSCVEWIRNFLETEDKLLVFATHRLTIDRMMKVFGNSAVRYDGAISIKTRDTNLKRFQNEKSIKLMFGMFDKDGKPAGVGITATAAAAAAFIELQWSPGVHDQAEGRIDRIGQTRGVNIYYLIGLGTIEERIAKLIDSKRKNLDQILDGKITETRTLLSDLIRQFQKGK